MAWPADLQPMELPKSRCQRAYFDKAFCLPIYPKVQYRHISQLATPTGITHWQGADTRQLHPRGRFLQRLQCVFVALAWESMIGFDFLIAAKFIHFVSDVILMALHILLVRPAIDDVEKYTWRWFSPHFGFSVPIATTSMSGNGKTGNYWSLEGVWPVACCQKDWVVILYLVIY